MNSIPGIEKGARWFLAERELGILLYLILFLTSCPGNCQSWQWKTETVDQSGNFTSLMADEQGNIHLSYTTAEQEIKYGFRPAGGSRWFSLVVDHAPEAFSRLTLDKHGDAHICYTSGELKYASWNSSRFKFDIMPIATASGSIKYACSVAVAADGSPQVAWYQYSNADLSSFLHLKYAPLREGEWQSRTIDFAGETGKWNSMTLDAQGNPHISYSAMTDGDLKYAFWNGSSWTSSVVDPRRSDPNLEYRGFGNSLVLDSRGLAHISYFTEGSLKYAEQKGNGWSLQTIDSSLSGAGWLASWSSLVLDRHGFPHIAYSDRHALKHAYYDGNSWHIHVIQSGYGMYRHSSMTIDQNDTLYVSYQDPSDNALKVAIGRLANAVRIATTGKN